jgi:PAS domain S-box-containing protein
MSGRESSVGDGRHDVPRSSLHPVGSFVFMLATVGTLEAFVMLFLRSFFPGLAGYGQDFLDSLLLVVLLVPALYILFLRPLLAQNVFRRTLAGELAASEERYRTVVDNVREIIFNVDTGAKWCFLNSSWTRLTGYAVAETIGTDAAAYLHPDDRTSTREDFRALLAGEQDYCQRELRLIPRHGEPLWVEAHVRTAQDEAGNISGVSGTLVNITSRKRAEDESRLARQDWEDTFDSISDLITIHSLNFTVLRANRAARNALAPDGVGPEKFKCFQCFHGGCIPDDDCPLVRTLATGDLHSMEYFEAHLNRYLEVRTSPRYDQDGRMSGIIHIARDITDRKRSELAISSIREGTSRVTGEAFFPLLVTHLAKALDVEYALVGEIEGEDAERVMTLAFSAGGIIQANCGYTLAGSPSENVAGQSLCTYERGIQALFPNDPDLAHMAAESYSGVPLIDSGGRTIGVLAVISKRPLADRRLTETLLSIFAARATAELERVRAEKGFRESETRFSQIFSQADDGIVLFNLDNLGGVAANPAALQLFGLTPEAFSRSGMQELLDRSGVHELIRRYNHTESVKASVYLRSKGKRTDGSEFDASLRCQVMNLKNDCVLFCSIRDISKKLRLEQEVRTAHAKLIQADKMTSLGLLVSGVAHEINNPNQCIAINGRLLSNLWQQVVPILEETWKREGELVLDGNPFPVIREIAPRLFEGIVDGSKRITTIVDNMKDFMRADKMEARELFDVSLSVRKALGIVDHHVHRYTRNFRVDCREALPQVLGSSRQIEQVLINLIMNALQALPDRQCALAVETDCDQALQEVVIRVIDEGRGMSSEVLQRLTEPFFTTKENEGGTGLGLYISSSIVKNHGGSLEFCSEPGRGTVATITLPVAESRDPD